MASAASYSTLVQELYVAYFGRPADYYGLQNFEAALAAANAPTDPAALATAYSTNAAIKSLVDSFGTSAESIALYGSGSTESFVNAIFENLIDRPAAVAGLTFWVDAIESGAVSKGDAALAILAGAEPASNSSSQATADWALVQAKVGVASDFTTALGASSTQIVDYSGATAAQEARLMLAGVTTANAATFDVQTTINNIVAVGNNTYSLTTGVDTIVGGPGNNIFNAILDNSSGVAAGGQAATLNAFDSITGGTLNNTLNITDFGLNSELGLYPALQGAATITGITTLNINSLEGVAGNFGYSVTDALNLTGWTDLTTLDVKSSNGYNNNIEVGSNVAVTFTDSGPETEYNYFFGGSTITLNNNSGNFTYNEFTGGSNTTAITINTTGSGDENFIYDQHNSGDQGYDGTGTTPGWSAGTNTIATVSISGEIDNATNLIFSDALTTLNLSDSSYASTLIDAASGTRTLTINLNNDGNGDTSHPVQVIDGTATAVDVNAGGTASVGFVLYAPSATALTFDDTVDLSLFDGGTVGEGSIVAPDAKSVTISGAGAFTADFSAVNGSVAINAGASSGVVTVELASATGDAGTQSFVGGTGQDIVTVGADQTGSVTAGSASNNEIVLSDAPGATYADLASYSHFSILGVSGATSGVFDMSKLSNGSGYTSFDVQGSGGNVTFTNVAHGSSLSVENSNGNIITLQTADTTGASDSVTLNLGTTTSAGAFYNKVTLEDANDVGIATVNLSINASGSHSITGFGNLNDNNLTTLNLSGNGELDMLNTLTVTSAAFTLNNDSTATGIDAIFFAGLSDNNLSALSFGGTTGENFADLNSTSSAMTIVDTDSAAVNIAGFNDTSLKSLTISATSTAATAGFTLDAGINETGLATLNLSGNVSLNVHFDAVTTGITVAAGSDNAFVYFDGNEVTASGAVDSITLGNGANDAVFLGSGVAGSTQTVVLGSGNSDIVETSSVGTVNITVGNGTGNIVEAESALAVTIIAGNGGDTISATAAGASISIAAGTGANTISTGEDASGTITLAAHSGSDAIVLGASDTSETAIVKIAGLNNIGTDTIAFADANNLVGFTQVTAGAVVGASGDTTLLASWVAAADGAAGSNITGAAHTVTWFQYQGNTYLLESVLGQSADLGTMATGNTLVELAGTGYTFHNTTGTGGVLHLLG